MTAASRQAVRLVKKANYEEAGTGRREKRGRASAQIAERPRSECLYMIPQFAKASTTQAAAYLSPVVSLRR